MKIGDKVRIKTGKRGRPPVGTIMEIRPMKTPAGDTINDEVRVNTKNGPEWYVASELTLVNPS